MQINKLDVSISFKLIEKAMKNIEINQEYINSLNVFPVPDGDTGTNVYATMKEAYDNIKNNEYTYAYELFNDYAKYMLYSARGNSGVIHSQVFAGLAKGLDGNKIIDTSIFSRALYTSKEATYHSVLSPQEGTILTVIRLVSENENEYDKSNFEKLFRGISTVAQDAVDITPEFLPVLKEVGVVDSGATALKLIFEGMHSVLTGEDLISYTPVSNISDISNTSGFSTEEIKYIYCTEFLILLEKDFKKDDYISKLSSIGDSIVAIELDGTVKSHVHTNDPNKVIEYALKYGNLNKIKIDNMHFEHNEEILSENEVNNSMPIEKVDKAIIAVSNSTEMSSYFKKLGVHYVIDGGQSKNPSTQDFVQAINEMNAKEVIILPNNSNIFMSAEQTNQLVSANVEVVKTKSVVQAYSILLVANKEDKFSELVKELNELLLENSFGEITKSVRDTKLNEININKNDYLGMYNKEIMCSNVDFSTVLKSLFDKVIDDDKEIVTIIKGQDLNKKMSEDLKKLINDYEEIHDLEFDIIEGNQEMYPIILGAD